MIKSKLIKSSEILFEMINKMLVDEYERLYNIVFPNWKKQVNALILMNVMQYKEIE